jgi:hypothetical protein
MKGNNKKNGSGSGSSKEASQLSVPDLIAQPRGEIRHLVLNTADPILQLVAGGLQVWPQKGLFSNF